MDTNIIDIREDDIRHRSPELLATLLKDHTMSRVKGKDWNIFWATSDYEQLGDGFRYNDQILPENITGKYGNVVQPRTCKDRQTQISRSRDKAEVFTPSWICNAQNNLIDGAWFEREGVFNTENDDKTWTVNTERITFPEGKTWKDYVCENRLEITCGEAPYLASRYDTVTGEFIPIERRIGLLDRKLRVVNENCDTTTEWLEAAKDAYKSTFGYEWQGDSLLIARETLLYTFIEYYRNKFGNEPPEDSIEYVAYIISWNLWQMDGQKAVVPNSCTMQKKQKKNLTPSLFGDDTEEECEMEECPGCKKKYKDIIKSIKMHNGIYCELMNWHDNTTFTFVSLIQDK
ncbi:MAG: restriction endonuclease subunit M [Muribaculaceae bacterium]